MRKSVCAMLCLLLLLSAVLPVKAAAETAPVKVVRVGSFEDTFNYCNEKGARKGYGYELLQTLSGYTGWQFEYVTCDWSDCFEKLENGEIDIMGGISYTEDRAEEMLFSDEPMGEEKYYLYADLSRADISAPNLKTLDGKKIGVVMGTEPEVMLTEWEEKHGIKTQHVNISNNEDVKQKLANHEIDCFVSLEESYWAELGISTITRVGKSNIYYVFNKDRPDLKEELDNAMYALDEEAPFYTADLCKKYFSLDYKPILTGEEKSWLRKHGAIRMGFLTSDSGVSTYDPATGEITGTITDYIQFAANCLGNQELEFQLVGYDDKEAELNALKSGEIDMIFHFDQSPNLAEEYRVARTNTTWTANMMVVTNQQLFTENKVNRVAVPQNKISLTRYIAFYYPQWEIVDCDTQEDARLYGYTTFNAVRYFEDIPVKDSHEPKNDAPEILYILYKYLIVFNDFKSEMVLIEMQDSQEKSHIGEIEKAINNRNYTTYDFHPTGETTSTLTDEEHKANIRKGIAHCMRGDVFQVVLTRRFIQMFKVDDC